MTSIARFLLVALFLNLPSLLNAETGNSGAAPAATGYGYGYEEYSALEGSNLFLGATDPSTRNLNVYPLDRNTFLTEVPEKPHQDDVVFGSYESSVNSFLDQKVNPEDDPSAVLENYNNLQSEFWLNRGAKRMEHIR